MNEVQRKRYEDLKKGNRDKVKENERKRNVLLQECLAALGEQAVTLSTVEEEAMIGRLNQMLKKCLADRHRMGDVRTDRFKSVPVRCLDDINPLWAGQRIYIVWDQAGLPVIRSDFEAVTDNMDDVKSVSFDTYLVSEDCLRWIELNHEGGIIFRFPQS